MGLAALKAAVKWLVSRIIRAEVQIIREEVKKEAKTSRGRPKKAKKAPTNK